MKIPLLKMNEVKTDSSAAGGGADAKQTQQTGQTTQTSETKSESTGNPIEDRYKKTAPQSQQQTTEQPDKTTEQKTETTTEEKSESGYGEHLEDVETAGYTTDEKKLEDKKTETPEEYELNLEGLEEADANDIKEFAKANKLPKEAAQALVEREKSNLAAMNQAIDKVVNEFKAKREAEKRGRAQKWQGELKSDKEFSGQDGQDFKPNLKKVDNILTKFFPNIKNDLTKNKGVLPPSAMRDILNLHKVLLSDDKRVDGETKVDDNIDPIEKRYLQTKG